MQPITPADRSRSVPFSQHFQTPDGHHDGGVACGIGFTIAWQKGPVSSAVQRNGAFLEDVLIACLDELEFHQQGPFANEYNAKAIQTLTDTIKTLQARIQDRNERGVLGTNSH